MDFNPDFEKADFEKNLLYPTITVIIEEEKSQS